MSMDLIGNELSSEELRLVSIYDELKALVAEENLAPTTRANLLVALSAVGVAVTGLGLRFEHLIDLGA